MGWGVLCHLIITIITLVCTEHHQNLIQEIPQLPLVLSEENVLTTGLVEVNNNFRNYICVDYGKVKQYVFPTLSGLRQDFLLIERPSFFDENWTKLKLEVSSAYQIIQVREDMIILKNLLSGEKIIFANLYVFDRNGNQLLSKFTFESENIVAISIQDFNAEYPIYIDPTYLDEDWVSLSPNWTNGTVNSVDVNKNTGEVYVGGAFTTINGVSANRVAKYNGYQWQSLGSGFNNTVMVVLVSDLSGWVYAGGSFTSSGVNQRLRISAWNGISWTQLGVGFNEVVYALVEGADGKLYAGGSFTKSGDNTKNLNHIAFWNGSIWDEPSLGVGSSGDYVMALSADNVGNIYVGGKFQSAGGISASNIARWDSNTSTWHPLGSGVNGVVNAITVNSEGRVYVGGEFTTAGGIPANRVALWNGTSWDSLGTGVDGIVYTLKYSDEFTLFIGGGFNYSGGYIGPNHLAWWYQEQWKPITSGIQGSSFSIKSLAQDSYGNLFVAGSFYNAGGVDSYNIAKLKRPPVFEVRYIASAGGTIFGQSPQYIMRGDNGTEVVAIPLSGFQFDRWSDNNISPSRTETNVTSNLELVAYFSTIGEGSPEEGSPDGNNEGLLEGYVDGELEGEGEGISEGEGNVEGISEGVIEGEGFYEGELEAENSEGTPDGYFEGVAEGATEGNIEGAIEGSEEGPQNDGEFEGYTEGEYNLTAWIDSPPNLDKEVGDTLLLLVRVSGGVGNLNFQWYCEDNNNLVYRLSGQTQNLLRIEDIQVEDTGWYWCEVSDEHSVVLTNRIYVRVSEKLIISSIFYFILGIITISVLFVLSIRKVESNMER